MKTDLPLLTIVDSVHNLPVDRIVTWDIGQELAVRAKGEFEMRAFYLPKWFDWVIGKDSRGQKILVALTPQEDENPGYTLEEDE